MPVDPARFEIAAVRPEQREAVRALLAASALPEAGLDDHWQTAWVAVDPATNAVLGSVALEIHGASALLRSLAARDDARSLGIGSALCDAAMQHARERSLESIGLLTTTAAPFFARRGFTPVPWEAMPPSLRASSQFQGACPSSAQAMILPLR